MALSIMTGFHWCSPLTSDGSNKSEQLLRDSTRWGAVILLYPQEGSVQPDFEYACNKVMDARQAVGGGRSLDQCIARLYWPTRGEPSFLSFTQADAWVRRYYVPSLNFFVSNGGRLVVPFNELNVEAAPQHNIDPRTIALVSYALVNAYWSGRLVYTLFPGPSGLLGLRSDWIHGFYDYFAKYDFLTGYKSPRTFDQYYGAGNVDPVLRGRTMLWHNGTGVFDQVALHGYAHSPSELANPDPNSNSALQYLAWMRDTVDPIGWTYVTEVSGADNTDYNSQYNAGSALADYENNANTQFRDASPNFLRGVYGYILQYSNDAAVSTPAHKIDNPFISGYNARRLQLGF